MATRDTDSIGGCLAAEFFDDGNLMDYGDSSDSIPEQPIPCWPAPNENTKPDALAAREHWLKVLSQVRAQASASPAIFSIRYSTNSATIESDQRLQLGETDCSIDAHELDASNDWVLIITRRERFGTSRAGIPWTAIRGIECRANEKAA